MYLLRGYYKLFLKTEFFFFLMGDDVSLKKWNSKLVFHIIKSIANIHTLKTILSAWC